MRCLFALVSFPMVLSLSGRIVGAIQEKESVFSTSSASILENLTPEQRENAIIQLECDGNAGVEARSIERLWNAGKYDEAISLLKASEGLKDAGLGIAWKNPVKASIKWGDDVLVSMHDSVRVIDMDIDNATGHLFAVTAYDTGTTRYWCLNISSDTGRTWSETYTWGAGAILVDCAVLGDFVYVAYSTNTGVGRIRRFYTSNGNVDFSYGYNTVIDEGTDIRDIVLTSDADYSTPHYLLYFAIMDNDSLRLYWSDTAATTWTTFNPPVGNASRGLDACVSNTRTMWASFIGTDNKVYTVGGWSSWEVFGPFDSTGSSLSFVSSIGAYGDTVIVVFPQNLSSDSNFVKYRIRYTDGGIWYHQYLYGPSDLSSYVSDVTARLGDGIGVVYQTSALLAGAYYRHRSYSNVQPWSSPVNIADSVAKYDVKPSIERVGSGIYGILYVNYPDGVALFDRSDWVSGIEEEFDNSGLYLTTTGPAVFNDGITINYSTPTNQRIMLDIYDFSGRHVKTLARGLTSGKHTVVWNGDRDDGKPALPGNYFCVLVAEGSKKVIKLTLVR